jgi:hypothetical protein
LDATAEKFSIPTNDTKKHHVMIKIIIGVLVWFGAGVIITSIVTYLFSRDEIEREIEEEDDE